MRIFKIEWMVPKGTSYAVADSEKEALKKAKVDDDFGYESLPNHSGIPVCAEEVTDEETIAALIEDYALEEPNDINKT